MSFKFYPKIIQEEKVSDLKVTYKELADTIDILLEAGILKPKPEEPEVEVQKINLMDIF